MRQVPKTVLLKLNSWRDFTKALFIMSKGTWLYRGHADLKWRLQSSLERELESCPADNPSGRERDNIELFRSNSKLLGFTFDSDIETLVAMQHHEAKTRLVDFSTSLMVALYFAFEPHYRAPRERVIYAVNFNALCVSDSLRRRYQEYAKRRVVRRFLDEMIKLGRGRYVLVEDVEFRRFASEAANDVIRNGSSEDGILPLYTAPMNMRQRAQAGVQLMPLTFHPFIDNLGVSLRVDDVNEIESPSYVVGDISKRHIEDIPGEVVLVKMVFDKKMEGDAINILDQANINAFTIYPDIIGLARSLRYGDSQLKGI